MKKWFIVAGARPNFMKIAPLIRAIDSSPKSVHIDLQIVHTGQHYDINMSDQFLKDLEISTPHHCLDVGGGSHGWQTGEIMTLFEHLCLQEHPDLVIVVGDVNSTLACALAARKLNIPIAHVEAGLRSFDKTMPEEVNRILTDHVSDILFCTEISASVNLNNEGIRHNQIEIPGDVMIDSLRWQLDRLPEKLYLTVAFSPKEYILLTMHRPSNVDNLKRLLELVRAVNDVSKIKPVVFPMHPRVNRQLKKLSTKLDVNSVHCLNPVSYPSMVRLMKDALLVITDSGGMQVEASYLKVPCLTLRDSTERPITLKGTNRLVGLGLERILPWVDSLVHGTSVFKPSADLDREKAYFLWDGHAAERIIKILMDRYL